MKVTPRHNAFIDAILTSSVHIITTVRRKQDYDMVQSGGRTSVVKVGSKEVTREGFEYELDVNFEVVNEQHLVKASKDRTGLFANQPEFIITEETGKLIKNWCDKGQSNLDEALELIRNCKSKEELTVVYNNYKAELSSNEDFNAAIQAKVNQFK